MRENAQRKSLKPIHTKLKQKRGQNFALVSFVTAREQSYGKVMFSETCDCPTLDGVGYV